MKLIQTLMDEHRMIEQVLSCVEKMSEIALRDGELDAEAARDAIAFLREFADRRHHGKEEDLLFPAMEQRGFSPENGPTYVMRTEHVLGRELIGRMNDAVDRNVATDFARAASEYVALLRAHIEKEDHCLFPMAEQALDPAAVAELEQGFRRVDEEELGESQRVRYVKIADRLAKRYGVDVAGVMQV